MVVGGEGRGRERDVAGSGYLGPLDIVSVAYLEVTCPEHTLTGTASVSPCARVSLCIRGKESGREGGREGLAGSYVR